MAGGAAFTRLPGSVGMLGNFGPAAIADAGGGDGSGVAYVFAGITISNGDNLSMGGALLACKPLPSTVPRSADALLELEAFPKLSERIARQGAASVPATATTNKF